MITKLTKFQKINLLAEKLSDIDINNLLKESNELKFSKYVASDFIFDYQSKFSKQTDNFIDMYQTNEPEEKAKSVNQMVKNIIDNNTKILKGENMDKVTKILTTAVRRYLRDGVI